VLMRECTELYVIVFSNKLTPKVTFVVAPSGHWTAH